MFRKLALALGATLALGTAAFAPTAASAFPIFPHPHHHWWHGPHFGIGLYGGGYGAGYGGEGDCYVVRKVVIGPFGPRVRRVQVCD